MIVTQLLLAVIAVLFGLVSWFGKRTLERIENKADKIEADLTPITPAVLEIQHIFTQSGHKLIHSLTTKPGSPTVLTDYGKRLMRESGFNKILANTTSKKTLVDVVKAMNPQTNYDAQECSVRTIQELLDKNNPMLNPLKAYAFNNGLPLEILVQPAGILLRDEVLKELKLN